jgi:hypothetical protein
VACYFEQANEAGILLTAELLVTSLELLFHIVVFNMPRGSCNKFREK